MSSKLTLDSDIVSKMKYVYGKKRPEKAIVYVEGHPDVTFWFNVLSKYENFQFVVNRAKDLEGSKANGCDQLRSLLEKKIISPGRNLIVCVDSDYRFILDDYNGYDEFKNNFVFETKAHSRESILSTPYGVDKIIKNSSGICNTDIFIDFEFIMEKLGHSLYNVQCLFLFLLKKRSNQRNIIHDEICNFLDTLMKKLNNNNPDFYKNENINNIINDCSAPIKMAEENIYKSKGWDNSEFENFKLKIIDKIELEWRIIFFIRGHDLYDRFFSKLISKACYLLTNNEKEKRKSKNQHEDIGEIYKNEINPVLLMERRNDFHNSFFFSETINKLDSIYL